MAAASCSPELGHLLAVVSSIFFFLIFFFKPKTPTMHVVRQHHPCSCCSSAPRVGFALGEQPRPLGCCSLMGPLSPALCQAEPRALGSVGSQHFITHGSEQPAHASIGNWAHSPAPSASLWILHWTPPSKYLFLLLLFFNRHFSPFFIAAFVL